MKYFSSQHNGLKVKQDMARLPMVYRKGWMCIYCVLGSVVCSFILMSLYRNTWRAQENYKKYLQSAHLDIGAHRIFYRNTHSISESSQQEKHERYDDESSTRLYWDRQYEGKAPFYLGDPAEKAKRLPDVILIGAPKGGTFALIQFMGFHPDLVIAQLDMDFFHVEENFRQGYDWYLNYLPKSEPWQLTMEKSPRYMFYDKAVRRIHRMNRDVKLLVVVRDPTERVVSCYVHRVAAFARQNITYAATFEKMAVDPRSGRIRFDEACIDTTLYAKHLIRWFKGFPSSQIHIVNGDKFIKNPYAEIKRIETYLSMKSWFTEDMFQYNQTKGFFCFKRPSSSNEVCMPPRKGRDHPEVGKEVVSKLRNFFRPYNDMLYEMAEENFNWDQD